jgi:lipoyl(octanoyl) transferase
VNAIVIDPVCLRPLGLVPYEASLSSMRAFTASRGPETPDELWLLQHPPVYTLGLAADPAFGPKVANGIPVLHVERGGEVTYHGPGQAVVYTLVDLSRRRIKVREFVALLEQSVVDLLAGSGVRAERRCGAPGVYVDGAKVAALGIRVSRGRAFHGLALNVDMDLAPFKAIDPCGYPGLVVTRTRDLGIPAGVDELGDRLARMVAERIEHA